MNGLYFSDKRERMIPRISHHLSVIEYGGMDDDFIN